jgi:hypothetical protein
MQLLYHFFDYKGFITGFDSDLFCVEHIIYIILAYISVVLLGIFLRNVNHKKFNTFLKGNQGYYFIVVLISFEQG